MGNGNNWETAGREAYVCRNIYILLMMLIYGRIFGLYWNGINISIYAIILSEGKRNINNCNNYREPGIDGKCARS